VLLDMLGHTTPRTKDGADLGTIHEGETLGETMGKNRFLPSPRHLTIGSAAALPAPPSSIGHFTGPVQRDGKYSPKRGGTAWILNVEQNGEARFSPHIRGMRPWASSVLPRPNPISSWPFFTGQRQVRDEREQLVGMERTVQKQRSGRTSGAARGDRAGKPEMSARRRAESNQFSEASILVEIAKKISSYFVVNHVAVIFFCGIL
jgi:hypothetical protein